MALRARPFSDIIEDAKPVTSGLWKFDLAMIKSAVQSNVQASGKGGGKRHDSPTRKPPRPSVEKPSPVATPKKNSETMTWNLGDKKVKVRKTTKNGTQFCNNFHKGFCTKSQKECDRQHSCGLVVEKDKTCGLNHKRSDHDNTKHGKPQAA